MTTLAEQPPKITTCIAKFSAEFEQALGITRPDGLLEFFERTASVAASYELPASSLFGRTSFGSPC